MKQHTATFKKAKECKHSYVFESADEKAPATSVYVRKSVIPIGAQECKITVSFPDGGQDETYNTIGT